ncbi:MAG: hypothetical protein E6Q36_06780 [Chryseobacterium sp.]|nr:MAG: hypothetical protein E6Q36_06780 [Chryseobacterium sp.]
MLTIEIPEKIRQLVAIAQMGDFPTSCWASEIVGEWLFDVAEAHLCMEPNESPITIDACNRLGIEYLSFVRAGGELYRQEAQKLLMRALGTTPDRPAFLRVSAMVQAKLMLSKERKTIELNWDDIMPGYARDGRYPATWGEILPMPVWQCLMRYYHEQWREPIAVWHHDVLNWIRSNYELISYPADQRIPFSAG